MQNTAYPGYSAVAAVVLTLGVFLLSQIVVPIILVIGWVIAGNQPEELTTWLESSVFGQFIAILLASSISLGGIAAYMYSSRISWSKIGFKPPKLRDAFEGVAGFGIYIVLTIIGLTLLSLLVPAIDLDQQQQLGFDRSTSGLALILVFLSLVAMPAFVEEVLVRGFLYTGLRGAMKFAPALIITSIIFGLGHLQLGAGAAPLWTAAVDTFILSVVLVFLRERTGRLWAPIGVHFLKNAMAFLIIFVI